MWLFIILAAIFSIGYGLGSAANHRRAEAIILRLQDDLHEVGTLSRLKHSGPHTISFRFLPKNGQLQFVDFLVTLEARELLPVWLWQRLRGQRDQLRLHANAISAPGFDIRIFPRGDQTSLQAMQAAGKPFMLLEEIKGFNFYVRGVGVPSSRDSLPTFIANYADNLQFLAIQSTPFHIQLAFQLQGLQGQSFVILYQSLQDIIK
jgi:hypothetical protein